MTKSILLLLILLIPVLALAQTAEEYHNKGVAKKNLGDYKGALQDFNKAIELDPKDADVSSPQKPVHLLSYKFSYNSLVS